ncbi:MAG: radical SAM protein [Candidatus Eremiobacteraeota bacterium]|nr:radical SAM protein [Candidatus Eremiobacteraeota bacterium]
MKQLALHGLDDIVEIGSEEQENKLLFIGLDMTKACNMNCIYCFESAGKRDSGELTRAEKIDILNQALKLGAKSLVIAGAGEPLLDSDFEEVIKYAYNSGMVSVVYTNGSLIDEKMARFMFGNNVTPIVKLDSLRPEIQDYYTRSRGSQQKSLQAIERLSKAGYSKTNGRITRIATASLYIKSNLDEIPRIVDWCLQRNIKPTVDIIGIHGRAIKYEDEIKPTREEILRVMNQVTCEESACSHKGCIVWKYGLFIGNKGDAKFCSEIPADIGNIRQKTLKELLEIKQMKYPVRIGEFTCPVKERFYT